MNVKVYQDKNRCGFDSVGLRTSIKALILLDALGSCYTRFERPASPGSKLKLFKLEVQCQGRGSELSIKPKITLMLD